MATTRLEQPLVDWLRLQDSTLRAWRDEVAASRDADPPLLERLEAHRRWLADEIASLLEGTEKRDR